MIRVCFLTLMVVLAACSKEEPAAVPEEATGFSEVIVEATGGNPAAQASASARQRQLNAAAAYAFLATRK